jgi:hypothetical protein
MNPTGNVVGRIAGIVMLCLALGCWPRASEGQHPQALAPLLALSLLAAGYLAYAGLGGAMMVGMTCGPLPRSTHFSPFCWLGPIGEHRRQAEWFWRFCPRR